MKEFIHEYAGVLYFFLIFWMFSIFFSLLIHWDHVKNGQTTTNASQEKIKAARSSARWAIACLFFGWLWLPGIAMGAVACVLVLIATAFYTLGSAFSNALPARASARIRTPEREVAQGQLSDPDKGGGLSYPPK